MQESAQNGEAEPTEKSPSPPPQPKKKAPAKRTKSDSAPKPRKRQKTQTPVSDDEATAPFGDESEEEVAKPKSRANCTKKKVSPKPATDGRKLRVMHADLDAVKSSEIVRDDSESEMSVVMDEEPKPKPARKRKSTETAPKKEKKPAPKAKSKDEEDPDQAEIKRLQGWLVKCGIRKMWFRELAPYDTAKAKIKHLKEMLEDAGMTGRYSQEKANKIRDERELKADLEMIQQGAKQWGKGSGDEEEEEEEEEGPPRRRAAARGRQALAFLESDGEESD